jgi:oligopeptide transport system substrate-binding protein
VRRIVRNMRGIIFSFLFLLLLALMGFTGCVKEQVPTGPVKQHLNYLLPFAPRSVDPGLLQDEAGYQFVTSLFEGLVRLEPDGSLGKGLAEDWQVTEDGKKYIFTLRDAKWSNGEKVTAYDFVAAVKRNLGLGEKCLYAYLLYDLKNAKAYHRSLAADYNGKSVSLEQVGIKAEDEKTLVMELEKEEPAFLQKLVHPVFYPIPPLALLDSSGTFFTPTGLVGNGPFKVVGEDTGESYELVKNEQYWDAERIKLESMHWSLPDDAVEDWQRYQEEQLDLTGNIPFQHIADGLKKGELKSAPLLTTYYYQFNTTQKPLADRRVRQALSYALDREKLVAEVLKGGQKPAQGIIPEGMPGGIDGGDFRQESGNALPNGDVTKAKELLQAAGYPEGQGFPQLELLISTDEGHQYLAEKIQQEWQERLGINVSITALPWPELTERMRNRAYQVSLMGWSADYADPLPYLQPFITGSGNNTTGWVSYEYDQLLKEAAVALSAPERMTAFHQVEKILLEELPVLPLYQYTKVYAVRDGIEGLFVSPLGTGFDFKGVFVAQQQQ